MIGNAFNATKGSEMNKVKQRVTCNSISYYTLIVFLVLNNIPESHLSITEDFDFDSDHSPVLQKIS